MVAHVWRPGRGGNAPRAADQREGPTDGMRVICRKDLREFKRQLQAVQEGSKRDGADILNRTLRNVAFRAAQITEFAEPGKIQAELYRDKILLKMATAYVRKKAGATKVDRYGNTKLSKRGRALKHGRVTRRAIAAAANKLLRVRISRSKAVRAGWIPAIKAMGGSVRGDNGRIRSGGSASKGTARKATPRNLSGEIANALVTKNSKRKRTPVEQIRQATYALQEAVRVVTVDLETKARQQINRTLRRNSD